MTKHCFGQTADQAQVKNRFSTCFSNSKYHNAKRQLINITAVTIVSLALGGCAIGGGVSALDNDPDIITGSIDPKVVAEGVDPADAEVIKQAVTDGYREDGENNLLAWSNPDTGNSGTITAIDKYIGTDGQSCKKFRTTVDSFMGISLYNGETCELRKGFWVLSWFIRDKSA